MEGIQTLKGSWPWPSIGPYSISSCISHRPLPIYQISFKLKKLFVDGRTYGRTDISPLYIIRSTLGSRPNKEPMIEKTGIIGGLDLPEQAEHTRKTRVMQWWGIKGGVLRYSRQCVLWAYFQHWACSLMNCPGLSFSDVCNSQWQCHTINYSTYATAAASSPILLFFSFNDIDWLICRLPYVQECTAGEYHAAVKCFIITYIIQTAQLQHQQWSTYVSRQHVQFILFQVENSQLLQSTNSWR